MDFASIGLYLPLPEDMKKESQPNPQGDNINQKGKFGVGVNQGELNQFNSINSGGTTNNIAKQVNNYNYATQPDVKQPPNNSPGNLADNFIGREKDLADLDKIIKNANQVAISAVAGMGGIGKSELAKQYICKHQKTYPGGICWLNATEDNFIAKIIELSGLGNDEDLKQRKELPDQVKYCYTNWRWQGNVLLVFDDVQNYQHVKPYLPTQPRFKVLITTRKRLGKPVFRLDLDVLEATAALDLLLSFVGEKGKGERETAEELCAWLGYLPLGLELVGRYLAEDEDLSVQEVLNNLKANSVNDEALAKAAEEMSAELGILAAIDLSWKQLTSSAQQLAYVLSLFAHAPIPWELVTDLYSPEFYNQKGFWGKLKSFFQKQEIYTTEEITSARKKLTKLNLLKRVDKETYLFHSLIREFLRTKEAQFDSEELKQVVCKVIVAKGEEIPQHITVDQVTTLSPVIPHLQEVATHLPEYLTDEDLITPFNGVGIFYEGQGLYNLAEPWFVQGKDIILNRLEESHTYTATILNNLAGLYSDQGRYEEAEPLYLQAIKIDKIALPDDHPDLAIDLNNLAELYKSQGRYEEAEPLYKKAIEISEIALPDNHHYLATSLNNLALLYHFQGRFEEAETLFLQAIQIVKTALPENHPYLATGLNNLALLYHFQGRFEEAETLFLQAIQIVKTALPENHPELAIILNNLAGLYSNQGRYEDAEYFYLKVLKIDRITLPNNHPRLANHLNNLAGLYSDQGRYENVEPLFLQAIKIDKIALPDDHPDLAIHLNNLADLYRHQGRYEQAEPLYLQALSILLNSVGEKHPHTQIGWENFVIFIKQVVKEGREKELSDHPLVKKVIAEISNE